MRALVAFALLQLGDVGTTYLSTRRHGIEVNPVLAPLLHAGPVGWAFWIGVKFALVALLALILGFCWWVSEADHREVRLGRDIVLVGIGVSIAMVALNLTVAFS